MKDKFFRAVLLQFSGIVGAGIFTLPWLYYHSNYLFSVVGLIYIAAITAIINIFYIDIINHTSADHQLPGFAGSYLGGKFKTIALVNLILTGIGATFAYHQLAVRFLVILIPGLDIHLASYLFLFFVIAIFLVKIKSIHLLFDYIPLLVMFISLVLFSLVFQLPPDSFTGLSASLSFFGITVFAVNGFTILPELREILSGETGSHQKLRLASLTGLGLVLLLYIIFTFSIIRLSGPYLSADSVTGLNTVSPALGFLLAVFGIFVTCKSFYNFLNIFFEIFHCDLAQTRKVSYAWAIVIPLLGILFLKISLVEILSLIGSITVSISISLICLIRLRLPHRQLLRPVIFLILLTYIIGLLVTLFT